MTLFWRAAPWLPRLLLLLATVLFSLIGFRYLGDPVNKRPPTRSSSGR